MLEYFLKELTNQVIFVTLSVRNPGVESQMVYTCSYVERLKKPMTYFSRNQVSDC